MSQPMNTYSPVDWGVAWFGTRAAAGLCQRCQKAAPVYQGYNGGQLMGVTMCGSCISPSIDETRAYVRSRPKPKTSSDDKRKHHEMMKHDLEHYNEQDMTCVYCIREHISRTRNNISQCPQESVPTRRSIIEWLRHKLS
jgi:predicted amidophosphoribosyltransferase